MRTRIIGALGLAILPVLTACDSSTDPDLDIADVQVEAGAEAIFIGDTLHLDVTVLDEDDDVVTDPDITYATTDSTVAIVDGDGIVTGVGEGVTEVLATAGGITGTLDLEVFDPEGPCFVGTRIDVPGSVQGTLEEGDCDRILNDGSFFDIWFFELDSDAQVSITLASDDFDAYLFLEDDDFTLLGEDDDSAGGTDARIEGTLTAGTYWVLANAYPDQSGDYTITVEVDGAVALRLEHEAGPGVLPYQGRLLRTGR